MIAPSVYEAAPAAPPQAQPAHVRFAMPEDDVFVEELQALAFGPGRFARTAFRVRERFPIDKSLSLIAEIDGTPVGSVWMTPISIGGIDGYMLGPLATHPNFRKRGAGKLLAREVGRIALERGKGSFIILVGDYDYYGPLGYQQMPEGNVIWPGPVDPKRVLLHSADPTLAVRLKGRIAAYGARNRT
jgi:predicted N-acetyltransferase YhbS